ncbi:hypothetical protein I4U23_004284 [Adineta vaga]|nr:hypothetical protein I4U23_004284 [Adineta vaga]
MASHWFILFLIVSLARFDIGNSEIQSSAHENYFPDLLIIKPTGWHTMTGEEIRSLFPDFNASMWYNGENLREQSENTLNKIVLPLFGFKKYPQNLQNGENNPNIIALITSIKMKQLYGVCDYQSHNMTLTAGDRIMNVVYKTSCRQVEADLTSTGFFQTAMDMNEMMETEDDYRYPKSKINYEFFYTIVYTDNINKTALNRFQKNQM